MKKQRFFASIVVISTLLAVVGCNNQAQTNAPQTGAATSDDQKILRVATEGTYAPFSYTQADGSLAGFDIDIANALCAKMQMTCDIQAQDWEGIIPALKIGKFDTIIAAMSVTPERSEQVDFTAPYFTNTLVFVAKQDAAFDPANQADMDTQPIAAQRSTIASQWLQSTYPKTKANLYDTLDNAFLDLGAGRSTAMVSDKATAVTWLGSEAGKGFAIKGNEVDINDTFAIAVNKGNDELRGKLDQALTDIRADGTYDELVKKHFGAGQ